MRKSTYLIAVAHIALATPAIAASGDSEEKTVAAEGDASRVPVKATVGEVVSTGVARGRDRLDMAVSTSALSEDTIAKLNGLSYGETLAAIPGVRAEIGEGEGATWITIRGLQLVSSGAKFVQLQEDGLPVLEFGDINNILPDMFLRQDIGTSHIEAIRGGSASTFTSNAPAGIINMISKTGETNGGAVQVQKGLDFGMNRIDANYGGSLAQGWRFNIGGFYRQGDGPRNVGYEAYRGGQIKANLTREFVGGYIRVYGKFFDDKAPNYLSAPIYISGTDDSPRYETIANFDPRKGQMLSANHRYNPQVLTDGRTVQNDMQQGIRGKSRAIGAEAKFTLGSWNIMEKVRYSDNSGFTNVLFPGNTDTAANIIEQIGGPGATLRVASVDGNGAVVADPSAINSNGLLAAAVTGSYRIRSAGNIVNDARLSRIWSIGGGDLTTTLGHYLSRQDISVASQTNSIVIGVNDNGSAPLYDIVTADGVKRTDNGVFAYNGDLYFGVAPTDTHMVYHTQALFGSMNYHLGKIVLGGSIRYDYGSAKGTRTAPDPTSLFAPGTSFDINGDGVISDAETRVGVLVGVSPAPVNYNYHYTSYSFGVNYRLAESAAVFARYSKGGRTNADRLLYTPLISSVDGSLIDKSALIDFVKQAEVGVKYRVDGLTVNLTGFWARALEHNQYYGPYINRVYQAYGLEFEGSVRRGPVSVTAGATYTKSKILQAEPGDPTFGLPFVGGNEPGGQPRLLFQMLAEYSTPIFSIGTSLRGMTGRYAQDTTQLRIPGYVIVNPFLSVRPTGDLELRLNANNVFNALAITYVENATIPANQIALAKVLNGRNVSVSARLRF